MMLEGMSVRAISRLTGLHKGTILFLMLTASQRAGATMDAVSAGAKIDRITPRKGRDAAE
jgi:hypothetical protein